VYIQNMALTQQLSQKWREIEYLTFQFERMTEQQQRNGGSCQLYSQLDRHDKTGKMQYRPSLSSIQSEGESNSSLISDKLVPIENNTYDQLAARDPKTKIRYFLQ
jgi:hypothetical protein